MKMEDLNDDCLMHIMQFLSIEDRVRIERVSKRWKSVSQDSWRGFKYLDWSKLITVKSYGNRKILKIILRRCGKYLIFLDFSTELFDDLMIEDVAKYCPNIQHIDVSQHVISNRSLRALSKKCTNLVSFAFYNVEDHDGENKLSLLFEKNKDLKRLRIDNASRITGKCLKKLNSQSIENIVIRHWKDDVEFDNLSVLKDFCNLKQLVINFVDFTELRKSQHGNIVKYMISSQNLVYLSLSSCIGLLSTSLKQISQLKNLKALLLRNIGSLDDTTLESIASHCKFLELLDIRGNHLVTNAGLANIFALPNLTFLNISCLTHINDEVFLAHKVPRSLRRMDCSLCNKMRYPGLVKLIETSENLEYLNLAFCEYISTTLIKAAVMATRKRKHRVVLELNVCETNVCLQKDTSPFLRLRWDDPKSIIPEDYEKCLFGK